MPRGKRDIEKTRRIVLKIKVGIPYKQIAFEEKTTEPRVSYIAHRYFRSENHLELNDKGRGVLNEEQLSLPFGVSPVGRHRVIK